MAESPVAVEFHVACSSTKAGDAVFICGSAPELGAWQIQGALRCATSAETFPDWASEAVLLQPSTEVEFKVAIMPADGAPQSATWEAGANRALRLSENRGAVRLAASCAWGEPGVTCRAKVVEVPIETEGCDADADGETETTGPSDGAPDADADAMRTGEADGEDQHAPLEDATAEEELAEEKAPSEVPTPSPQHVAQDASPAAELEAAEAAEEEGAKDRAASDAAGQVACGAAGRARAAVGDVAERVKTKAAVVAASAKSLSLDRGVQTTAAAAAVGGVALGTAGGATGLATGATLGAAVGLLPAPFTLGLSIPFGAAIGAGAGLVTGVTAGSVVGVVGGGAAGYGVYARRAQITAVAGQTLAKVEHVKATSVGFVREKAFSLRARWLGGGTSGTEEEVTKGSEVCGGLSAAHFYIGSEGNLGGIDLDAALHDELHGVDDDMILDLGAPQAQKQG